MYVARIVILLAAVAALASAVAPAPQLVASPDVIATASAMITVKWTNIPNPSSGDYIALVDDPIDTGREPWTTLSNSNAASAGAASIELLNWRSSYRFIYYNFDNKPIAKSNMVACNKAFPTQVHIAVSDQPNSYRIMFTTGTNNSVPTVRYGFAPNALGMQAQGESTTYDRNNLCGLAAAKYFLDPGYIHSVILNDLPPNSEVWYQVSADTKQAGEILSFRTSPRVAADSSISVFAFGDSGVSYCQNMIGDCQPDSGNTYNNIKNDLESDSNFTMVIHIGDIAYAWGFANRWEQYFHQMSPIASRVPYMVSIGNHEYDYVDQPYHPYWGNYGSDSGGECGVPYSTRFRMPGKSNDGQQQSLWYSFDHGNVHFTFMSAEHAMEPGTPQYEFLRTDLAGVDRSVTPFVVFSGHRPMYTTEDTHAHANISYVEAIRMNLEPLLQKYSVDLAMWAHVHAYERTCPIFNGVCTDGATTHVVIGMAGMDIATELAEPQPNWIVYREAEYGYTRIFTSPDSLTMQYVRNDGQVRDEFSLKRKF